MIKRLHILGASGAGTTTLAKALAKELFAPHFDTDDYYWLPTTEPFTEKRDAQERHQLLQQDLAAHEEWILSGSLCGWGDLFIPQFDMVVFVYTPHVVRIQRLAAREGARYGSRIQPGGDRYQSFIEFLEWASKYDHAGPEMRSRQMHELWLTKLPCPVLRLEGDHSVQERVEAVMEMMTALDRPSQ